MATYKSTQMTLPEYPVPGVGEGSTIHVAFGEYVLAGALALNDLIEMFQMPRNARIHGAGLYATDLDTGGSPAIVLALGDAVDDDRFITGATIGQTGGFTNTLAATGAGYRITTQRTKIIAKVTTGPATGATTGTIRAWLMFSVEEPYSA